MLRQVLVAAEDVHALAKLRCRLGLLLGMPRDGSNKIDADTADAALDKIGQVRSKRALHRP